jgi:ATP-binding cassette subfamily F protein uup
VEAQRAEAQRAANASSAVPAADGAAAAPKPKRLAPWEQRELDGLPAKITELEMKVAELEARLADPALYRRSADEQKQARDAHIAVAQELEQLMERWEALESRA